MVVQHLENLGKECLFKWGSVQPQRVIYICMYEAMGGCKYMCMLMSTCEGHLQGLLANKKTGRKRHEGFSSRACSAMRTVFCRDEI